MSYQGQILSLTKRVYYLQHSDTSSLDDVNRATDEWMNSLWGEENWTYHARHAHIGTTCTT